MGTVSSLLRQEIFSRLPEVASLAVDVSGDFSSGREGGVPERDMEVIHSIVVVFKFKMLSQKKSSSPSLLNRRMSGVVKVPRSDRGKCCAELSD